MKKAFQMKSKAFFIDFEGLSFGEKTKNSKEALSWFSVVLLPNAKFRSKDVVRW